MKNYLFFDTETTGLPANFNAPASDTNNWPRLVQIAWQLYDEYGTLLDGAEYVIRPEGFSIPAEASNIHGVTQERAVNEGVSLVDVLHLLNTAVGKSDFLVAHNMAFDEKIVRAEYFRTEIDTRFQYLEKICTMQKTSEFCAIENDWGQYKWPKLTELHQKLFGVGVNGAHNAMIDVQATAKCFFHLRNHTNIFGKPPKQLSLF